MINDDHGMIDRRLKLDPAALYQAGAAGSIQIVWTKSTAFFGRPQFPTGRPDPVGRPALRPITEISIV